jgi:hypothetical protein
MVSFAGARVRIFRESNGNSYASSAPCRSARKWPLKTFIQSGSETFSPHHMNRQRSKNERDDTKQSKRLSVVRGQLSVVSALTNWPPEDQTLSPT